MPTKMEIGADAPDDDGTVVIRVSDRLRGWRMNFQPRNVVHGERSVAFMCRNIYFMVYSAHDGRAQIRPWKSAPWCTLLLSGFFFIFDYVLYDTFIRVF